MKNFPELEKYEKLIENPSKWSIKELLEGEMPKDGTDRFFALGVVAAQIKLLKSLQELSLIK